MKVRLKLRDMPGDIPMGDKISLYEGNSPESKKYKKMIRMKERAVEKRRFIKECDEETKE